MCVLKLVSEFVSHFYRDQKNGQEENIMRFASHMCAQVSSIITVYVILTN